jgi:hypothetical protein
VDWVFWAFIALAGCAFTYKEAARSRVRAAEDQAAACLAQRDAACVAASIDRGRAAASATEPRLDIAGAGLSLLSGDLVQATRAVAVAKAAPDLAPLARGELLLVEGDLAEARGDVAVARDNWTAAVPFVADPNLVRVRRARADAIAADRAQALSVELESLAGAFDELFALAPTMPMDRLSIRTADLRDRISHLPASDARAKLFRAIDVAVSASGAAARKRAPFAYDPFTAPPPAPVDPPPEMVRLDPRRREWQQAEYRTKLEIFQAAKKSYEDRKAAGEAEAVAAARSILEEGAPLVHDALAAVAAGEPAKR